jgi:Protein of unknown function (DUF1236)
MWIGKSQMRKTLMVSVAVAALFAAAGLATAQGINQGGVKASETPAAASPKGDSAAPMNAPAKGAETAAPAAASKEAMPQHAQGKPDAKATGAMKADGKSNAAESSTPAAASKEVKTPTAETKSTTDSKTTGNAATSATAAPPAEKRTEITSAIKQEKVQEVTNVNFNISIGTTVPAGVHYYPLSPRIVEIYPEWRGYEFILVHGKYIILRPHTHEIVYIIEG